ncbi:MAG: hypothetical protein IKP65_09090 [Alphaproteobacteria bacterium]|nr:hypothetical protein [Alphaproteobacteria bacterium]
MKINLYVNPNFIRGGVCHGKVMFSIENLGWFGCFINGQTGKIEKQAYEWGKFKWKNIQGDSYNGVLPYRSLKILKSVWNILTDAQREKIFHASIKASEALKYFIKKYNTQINSFANAPYTNPRETIGVINEYVWYYIRFISALHSGSDFNIDPKFENGVFPAENVVFKDETEQIKETVTETPIAYQIEARKSKNMFKITNANNLENLFEGNFYPIVNTKNCCNGYITVKDDEGNECTIRTNRGKEIQVYTDCPA